MENGFIQELRLYRSVNNIGLCTMEKTLLLFILIVTSGCVVESYMNEMEILSALRALDDMAAQFWLCCVPMRDVPVESQKKMELHKKKLRSIFGQLDSIN